MWIEQDKRLFLFHIYLTQFSLRGGSDLGVHRDQQLLWDNMELEPQAPPLLLFGPEGFAHICIPEDGASLDIKSRLWKRERGKAEPAFSLRVWPKRYPT